MRPRAGSSKGRWTIDVCGLDREKLRKLRERTAFQAHKFVRSFLGAVSSGDPLGPHLEDLYHLGKAEYEHAGIVRAIFVAATDLSWDWLETEYRARRPASAPGPVPVTPDP